MAHHVIQYTLEPGAASRNDQLLADVFAELDDVRPAGLSYTVYRLADGLTYMHIIDVDHAAGHDTPKRLASLQAFHAGIRERCQTGPERTSLTRLGSFALATP